MSENPKSLNIVSPPMNKVLQIEEGALIEDATSGCVIFMATFTADGKNVRLYLHREVDPMQSSDERRDPFVDGPEIIKAYISSMYRNSKISGIDLRFITGMFLDGYTFDELFGATKATFLPKNSGSNDMVLNSGRLKV